MTAFSEELQSLSPSALVEFFILDMTNTPGGGFLYFHDGATAGGNKVTWQGQEYDPWPIETEGFDISTQGVLPRPKMRIANMDGLISAEANAYGDLLGCMLIRKRTFVRFLDAVNFAAGNPEADPNQHAEDDKWFVDQKTGENRYVIEFELASVFDLMGIKLPSRQVLKSACPWKYRGPECGYTGPFYDRFDNPSSAFDDACSKLLASCKVRHPRPAVLPYGGFPGATRYEA